MLHAQPSPLELLELQVIQAILLIPPSFQKCLLPKRLKDQNICTEK